MELESQLWGEMDVYPKGDRQRMKVFSESPTEFIWKFHSAGKFIKTVALWRKYLLKLDKSQCFQ